MIKPSPKAGTAMLDAAVRISFLLLGGLALVLALSWYVRFCFQEIRGTGQVVIDAATVVDGNGKSDGEIGTALALMLQSRLETLANDLNVAQAALTMTASPSAGQIAATRVADVRLWTQDVALHAGLLQPVEMKLSVAGVDVGGLIPWLQRKLSNRRTLHFTVYFRDDEAQVLGSLAPMGLSGTALRLVIPGANGKAPPLDVVVDRLAYEIIRQRLVRDATTKMRLLQPAEFVTLAEALIQAAESNRRAVLGRPVQNEFADVLPRMTALADALPDWTELNYFAAWIADKARNSATAVVYYERVVQVGKANEQTDLVNVAQSRLTTLTAAPTIAVAPDTNTSKLPALLDLSSELPTIKDSGPEGSVVGMALASALEAQIARTKHARTAISARYIYNAARDAAGTGRQDSGARVEDGVKILTTKGAVEEKVWPYVPGQFAAKPPAAVETATRYRITDVRRIKGLPAVKVALKQTGPVVAGISVYQSMMTAAVSKTGDIPMPAKNEMAVGGHAVVIVGYDDARKRVKFANSWGSAWGEKGFGYLPYDYIAKYMYDAWSFKLAN